MSISSFKTLTPNTLTSTYQQVRDNVNIKFNKLNVYYVDYNILDKLFIQLDIYFLFNLLLS